jgi:hypothetical protein
VGALERRSSGKLTLPAKRPRRPYRESQDVASGARRLVRALGRRLAEEDLDALELLLGLELELAQAWAVAVAGLRLTGASDRDIGAALGVTRQAVEQRWPRVS